MPVPTHRFDCKTKKFFFTKCWVCGKPVFFWSCTCGSKVLFESGSSKLIKHDHSNAIWSSFNNPSFSQQRGILSDIVSNPLINCPFCGISLTGRSLSWHAKQFHANDINSITQRCQTITPLLDGVEIQSLNLIQEIKCDYLIDENGFLILADMVPEASSKKFVNPTGSPHPKEQPHVFAEIRSVDKKIPGARIKKYRPLQEEEVKCPICCKAFYYKDLFDHVTNIHKEQKAKIVLAKFNREYEKLAKWDSGKP